MFGFHYLSMSKVNNLFDKNGSLFSDELLDCLFGFDKKAELIDGTLLDTHQYTVGDLTYEQRVYRLKDNSIFVDTKQVKDTELESLTGKLAEAIKSQNFEEAAILRDKIKSLKTN
jgi:hypothetical protein